MANSIDEKDYIIACTVRNSVMWSCPGAWTARTAAVGLR